jgi:CheY-like chemotaxis protein
MNKIAIIDDDFDHRETLRRSLEVYLENKESELVVIDIFPFSTDTFEEYHSWIIENNIICLIFDEQMHNQSEDGHGPVGYRGNDLVIKIRQKFKDIPIYVITSNKSDHALNEKFSAFEDIIARDEFNSDGEKYVSRILRACQRYLDENEKELIQFHQLATKVATGSYTLEDYDLLQALQIKLDIKNEMVIGERRQWLDEYEARIQALEAIKEDLKSKLDKS